MLNLDTLAPTFGGHELRYLAVGDQRLKARGILLLNQFCEHAEQSVPLLGGSPAALVGSYRWFHHTAVTPAAITTAHRERTLDRIRPLTEVLLIQDTSELDYTTHPATTGMGPLSAVTHQGLHVHTVLAATPGGVPLGVLHQAVWARDLAQRGQAATRRRRTVAEKESRRWGEALTASHQDLPAHVHTITLADREADIFALFAQDRPPQADLLIRAAHNRAIAEEARYLEAALQQAPARGTLTVSVTRRPEQPARVATLTVRWTTVTLCPPHRARGAGVVVQVLLADELAPPPGVAPLRWLLVTTLPVTTLAQAKRCVRLYAKRWLIERFHFVLKSGCGIERLQLTTPEAVRCALALLTIVAWRLLHLLYLARQQPDLPCTVAFSPLEWRTLQAWFHRDTPPPPAPPPLATVVRWVARLGGFLNRTGDGEPGVKTLWRGLRRLADLLEDCRFAWQWQPSAT